MKIRITFEQLKRVLETEPPKFPITIGMKGIDKKEMDELVKLLNPKQK